MIRSHSRIEKRAAFTLIELMVVILIIAVLVSMLLAGVSAALRRGPIVQTRVEIGQLEAAVQTVVAEYRVKFVPSQIKLSESWSYSMATPGQSGYNALDYNSVQFLKRMFPRLSPAAPPLGFIDWNRNGTKDADVTLRGAECLVFFLGGPGNQGFSADPANPANLVSLKPPAYNFSTSRLLESPYTTTARLSTDTTTTTPQGVHGYFVYLNNYGRKSQPYMYCTSYYQGNDYVALDCQYPVGLTLPNLTPYVVGLANGPYVDPSTSKYVNPNAYQIISAGAQGVFGGGGTLWSPISGSIDQATKDNQANFAPGLLVAGQ